MKETGVLTVSQLNLYIKALIGGDSLLNHVYVKGEISNCKIHTSGHIYLTLKDEGGLIRSVCFRSSASKLKFSPENGQKIIARGRVAVFERDGQYQLYIDDMQPDGIGALHLAFEQLKQKLQQEGLFALERKRKLPKVPAGVGVVTAPTGAAVRDIIHIISRRFPLTKVVIYPVLVQGDQAPDAICEAISYFNKTNSVDVLIVGRGGGSIEDLWAFNSEKVARTIADSRLPIISAVGHETDFTIADFVADLRAPTPSAAAEIAVPDKTDVLRYLNDTTGRLKFAMAKNIDWGRVFLDSIRHKRVFATPKILIEEKRMILDHTVKNMDNSMMMQLKEKQAPFGEALGKLEALSPLKVLTRGYSILKDAENRVISSVNQVVCGQPITVTIEDGEIIGKVEQVRGGSYEKRTDV
jgi:exodeoxyribonuclease VII large subunit